MEGFYILNRTTSKLELHFDKSEYQSASPEDKKIISSNFLFSRRCECWVSRCKWPNTSRAARVAAALGLTDGGQSGDRLTYAEQMQQDTQRAENRAARYTQRAEKAAEHAEQLQKAFNDHRGDIAWMTQPNIDTTAGRAFTSQRDKIMKSFEKGFEEFNRSAYWRKRAAVATVTADHAKLNNKGYIMRQIKQAEKTIRKQRENLQEYDARLARLQAGEQIRMITGELLTVQELESWIEKSTEIIQAALDKLGFMQDRLQQLGGVAYSRHNVHVGDVVKLGGLHQYGGKVASVGPKHFKLEGCIYAYDYAEIEKIISNDHKAVENDKPEAIEAEPETVTLEQLAAMLGE